MVSFVEGPRAGIQPSNACLIDYLHMQIVLNPDLAGKTSIGREFSFNREPVAFEFSHFTRVALENFDPAGRAASVAAATVKYVDTSVFKHQNEFLSIGSFGFDQTIRSLSLDLWHLRLLLL
jgi:hypothetical protein